MIKRSLIKKIVSTDLLQCPYSVETHHPLLHRDPEKETNQIYLYASETVNEAMLSDMYPMVEKGYMIEWHKIRKTGLKIFLINCRILGVTELVFWDGTKTVTCSLNELLDYPELPAVSGWSPVPKWDSVPVERRPITNPEMQAVLLYSVQEMRRKVCPGESIEGVRLYQTELTERLLTGNVIVPLTLKAGRDAESGQLTEKDFVGVNVVTDLDGNEWVPVFTDQMEYTPFANEFFKGGRIVPSLNTIPNLASGLPKNCKGIIINPDTASYSLSISYLEQLLELAKKTLGPEA